MTPHWTSALPPGWKVEKLKYLAEVRLSNADKKSVDGEQPVRLCNYVDVYKNDFITPTMPFMEATATDSQLRELALRAGDVLITKDSEEWNDIAVPAFVQADLPGVICGYHLAHIRPDPAKMFGSYLFRAFAAQGIADQFKVAANGITRYGISKDDIESALFPVPSLSEQRAIAEFLDGKTAELDALIVKKERLIDLLREERRVVVTRAVTHGLNTGVPMKESGFPWLGQVPTHWEVKKLKHAVDFLNYRRIPLNSEERADLEKVYPYYGASGIIDHVDRYIFDEDLILIGEDGANLLSRSTPLAFIATGRYWVNNHAHILKPRTGCLSFWVERLNSIAFDPFVTGSAQPKLTIESLANIDFAAPGHEEQREIEAFITTVNQRIDIPIRHLTVQIAKLHEYRLTLISAAVRGKIAVTQQQTVVAPVEPAKKPNPYFRRMVFAAEIIDQLGAEPTFGHVKFQKVFFVAQHHLRVGDFEENYHRQAAGPYDNQMIRSVDSQLGKQKWFAAKQTGERYVYERLEKAGQHKKYFDGWFRSQAPALGEVLALFRKMTTEQAEIVATLYAAWNDFLLLGEPHDDDGIIEDVLTNWHESKRKIPRDKWRAALDWMRAKNLVPSGFGKPTRAAITNQPTPTTAGEDAAAGSESEV